VIIGKLIRRRHAGVPEHPVEPPTTREHGYPATAYRRRRLPVRQAGRSGPLEDLDYGLQPVTGREFSRERPAFWAGRSRHI